MNNPAGFAKFCKKTVQMLTGIPTVIYGFVGVFLLAPFIREMFASGSGMSILSASLNDRDMPADFSAGAGFSGASISYPHYAVRNGAFLLKSG